MSKHRSAGPGSDRAPTSRSAADEEDWPKRPTRFTAAANQAAAVSFDDPGDFERAGRGLIATLEDGRVSLGDHLVFDVARHAFVSETAEAPDSVHPGLWRQARLNANHGLFEVAPGAWQVRGYDLANITFMEGEHGWLVIDPLTNAPAAAAALGLANQVLGERPVSAVIYTHSHVDHFGGILGVTSNEAVDRGDVRIVAPDRFLEEVIGEFVIAGPIMGRRAAYQFGPLLEPGPLGHVDCGLGSAMGLARSDLIAPTESITETGQELTLDGIRVVFQMTPDAEAPAEMNFFFPNSSLLCMAENCTHTLHNLYPIRGAQTRDALAWSKYIQEAADLWADDTDTLFASHHWPRFGNDDVRAFLAMQRDVYRWLHDQTMRLANLGLRPDEIAAELELPAEFDQSHVRGYYGTVSHNCRSVYNRYLGWYDGNPANLEPLTPVDAAVNYVEFMGGAADVLAKARRCFERGEYRWVAQVVNHVVFADPANAEARRLQADALEQLGYQSEAATWRNAYLMGAKELREGSPQWGRIPTRHTARAMRPEHIFDVIGVRFDPQAFAVATATSSGSDLDAGSEHCNRPAASDHEAGAGPVGPPVTVNFWFSDLDEHHVLGLGRSALHHRPHVRDDNAIADVQVDRACLVAALDDAALLDDAVARGDAVIEGDGEPLRLLLGTLTHFESPALIEP